jgi:hypothetical protein
MSDKIPIESDKEWACNPDNYFEVWHNNKELLHHWELRDIQLFALMNMMDMDEQNVTKIDHVIACLEELIIEQKKTRDEVGSLHFRGGR